MCLPMDWRADPIVQIESEVVPFLVETPGLLGKLALGRDAKSELKKWLESSESVRRALASGFDECLVPMGFPLASGERTICQRAAHTLRQLTYDMKVLAPGDNLMIGTVLARFETVLVPKIQAALDAARATFITGVLTRQASHAVAAHTALAELRQIKGQTKAKVSRRTGKQTPLVDPLWLRDQIRSMAPAPYSAAMK